ncbi:MAG: DUF1634 domain-containing protein [Acidobacteria bacterium]|nr:DUF1634 domain-containing protein [Acidobacteriota bacterium]
MSERTDDLEIRYRWLSIAVVILVGGAFALGLILYVLDRGSGASLQALNAGLLLLMAAPAVRILVAGAEQIRRGDWTFVLLTAIVAAEIGVVLWRASARG